MKATSAVVLVVDRLGAGWLGPYGNTWLETPNFNRLAAESVLCETVIANSPDLAASYRAYWTGQHAIESADTGQAASPGLASLCRVPSMLVTDDQHIAELPEAAAFSDRRLVPASPATASAAEIEQTELFRLFFRGHRAAYKGEQSAIGLAAFPRHEWTVGRAVGAALPVCR